MKIGIIGAGFIGTSLAKKLVKAKYKVELSNSRGPESLSDLVKQLGRYAKAVTNDIAATNEVVIISVRWEQVENVLKSVAHLLKGKILIDATNPFLNNETLIDFKDKTASEIVSSYVPDAYVVKAFNALLGEWIDSNPKVGKGNRVVFISGDHEEAKTVVAQLITDMEFAPVDIGDIKIGGALQQAGKPLAALNLIKL
jgi:predicted dinucleotide-binding enzyme